MKKKNTVRRRFGAAGEYYEIRKSRGASGVMKITWHEGTPPLNPATGNLWPGTLVVYKGKIYLVGDVNTQGGECNCCSYFSPEEIERWAQLEIPELT